jgi:tyrosyl-tRNA synthetase
VDLFDDLVWRGLAHQWTGEDALPARLRQGPLTLYFGCDPSAPSLHLGNLVGLVALRRFQRAGHRPIALAGGATGMIGDPSGRSEERNLLSPEALGHNVERIKSQLERFIDFDAGGMLVNNYDWFQGIGFIEFLRDVGKHFSVNVMLARESVRARLESESGISYTEFSYQLMQGYDFVHLYDTYGCELQIGGSDQYGNIVAGADLIRRMRGAQAFGFTWPLVTRSDGAKMGKTAAGAVWLDPELTSPYSFYQYFLRVPDADAGNFLRIFTELSHAEISDLERQAAEEPHKRAAQQALARELTTLVHGPEALGAAERATAVLFGGELAGLTEAQLLEIFADVPSVSVPSARLGALTATDALVEAGLAKSRGDARRLIEAGGATVGNRRIAAADETLSGSDLASETVMVLRAGKKSFALLRFTG